MNPDFNTIAMLVFGKMYVIKLPLFVRIIAVLVGGVIVIGLFSFWLRHKNKKTDSKE